MCNIIQTVSLNEQFYSDLLKHEIFTATTPNVFYLLGKHNTEYPVYYMVADVHGIVHPMIHEDKLVIPA